MRLLTTTLLFSFLTVTSFGQGKKIKAENGSGAVSQLTTIANPKDASALARKDIANKHVFLVLQGGFAPIKYSADKSFEKKYSVQLRDFGCVSPDKKLVVAYNKETFRYLTKTFGKKWIKECRKDIIGLQEYTASMK